MSEAPPIHPALLKAESILDSLNDGVYVTDTKRRIVFWNKAAERIMGWTAGDVVGSGCYDGILCHVDISGHPLCGREFCPLHRAIVTNTCSTRPVLLYGMSKHRGRVPLEVSVAPICDDEGRVIGGAETFRDMTETTDSLLLARDIQEEVLAHVVPTSPLVEFSAHSTPSDLVGGDFYRIEEIEPDVFACALADVSGHGVSAALHCMFLRALWEEFRPWLGDPGQFLARANDRLSELASTGCFATALHGVLDAKRRRFTYSSAGHPPPLLSGVPPGEFISHGRPLGIAPGESYGVTEVVIEPGQRVYLYSDGAIEAPNEESGNFGVDRLHDALDRAGHLSPLERFHHLEEALLEFAHAIRHVDDLTLLEIQMADAD